MSIKKVEQVKNDNGFKLFDLIIYGVIILIVAITFIALAVTADKSELTGVKVVSRGEVVAECDFSSAPVLAESVVSVRYKDGYKISVEVDGEINVIYIDCKNRRASMLEANCQGKQCIYSHEVDNNSRIIYCSPHSLKIEPLKKDLQSPDVIM